MRSLSVAALAALLPLACTAHQSRSLLNTTSDWTRRTISLNHLVPTEEIQKRQTWSFSQPGTTGVLAMQMTVISETQLLIIDRVSNNSMQIDGHSAWASVYSTATNTARPVRLTTNSFCAGGSFLSNGTLVNIGGFTAEIAEVPDRNGLQAIRHFEPSSCPDTPGAPPCSFYENVERIRLAVARWYPTIVRLHDGSTLIIGGAKAAPFMNNATINVASVEHYPPKSFGYSDGMPLPMQFLADTLNANLFPLAFVLPNTKVFLVSNNRAVIYDWRINKVENIVPPIPNGVRVSYPMTGSGTILPLEQAPDGSWAATILICGGTSRSDTVSPGQMSSQDAASSQCASITYNNGALVGGWTVENMPEARIMPDMVLLPDGRVLIVNGAQTGYAGYGNVNQQVGASNADHPTLKPLIYDPTLPVGQRFTSAGLPTSSIPRMYHSVASLLPSGAVAITGSNPNGKAVSGSPYPTEYRMELLSPPYMTMVRPIITGCPRQVNFNGIASFNLTVPPGTQTIRAAILDLGFSTHSLHMNMRHVWLQSYWSNNNQTYNVRMPPGGGTIFPPSPGWLYILADGVASVGQYILVGNGASPPVVQAFIDNMLNKTANPQG